MFYKGLKCLTDPIISGKATCLYTNFTFGRNLLTEVFMIKENDEKLPTINWDCVFVTSCCTIT